jgi:hypothetical protein
MIAREFPAITLWQPYASLLAAGIKAHETRGFRLPERLIGQWVAIHAAKRQPALLERLDRICRRTLGHDYFRSVPRGAVLALVRFTSCKGTMLTSPAGYEDEIAGDWGPGRYAWRVGDRCILPAPFHIDGRQLWWRVTLEPPPDLGEDQAPTQRE